VSTWEKCSNAFLAKFFPLGKTNALQKKISGFQQLTDETIAEAWVDSLSPGAYRSAAGGSFFALSIEEARKLVEKMASNQSWDEERTQTCTCKVHQLEAVDMLTAKIDLLMKKLENPGLDHLKIVNA
jgi:hypothetical protein